MSTDNLPPLPQKRVFRGPNSHAAYAGTDVRAWGLECFEAGKRAAIAADRAARAEEIDRLKALSVTNILLDVVPGENGMGKEVYAASVDQVVAELSRLGQIAEDAASAARAEPKRKPLTEAQIEDAIDEANRLFIGRHRGPCGQQMTTYDDWKHWLARAIERAHGIAAAPEPKPAGETR